MGVKFELMIEQTLAHSVIGEEDEPAPSTTKSNDDCWLLLQAVFNL